MSEQIVRHYRAYLIDASGRFQAPIDIYAATDAEAIASAEQYLDGHDVALWEGERPVTTLQRKTDE